ncbi:transketolase [Hyphobacterium marinum]|uniref:Transketolase n=1 Tax=Hyphobacterium marinum TaxID=3116574 RepID=A0ABU7LY03_9PROT|nr:transketolase [Hyphobacterium sp. Y6023]MEE2566444.1 transketolase [Hyphobacterium sp. Y6023]
MSNTAPSTDTESARLKPMANAIRALAMDAVEQAKSGHPGMPMGMADAATVLWAKHLKFDPADPNWPDRDRFVLSAGHGSMLIYALLHLTGFADVTLDEIRNFRQLGSKTPGHPEFGHTTGVETTTGPLGQGISTAVGMALAERMANARFGDELVDHRTWVIASDGDLQEGISHEAISLAGHLKLNRLVVLWDDNEISIDGSTELSESTDVMKRFEAAGWATSRVNGHDMAAVDAALEAAKTSDKPVLIACRTTIGFGAPTKAGKSSSHGAPLGADEIIGTREALAWDHVPFDIPAAIRADWAAAALRGERERGEWLARLNQSEHKRDFERALSRSAPASVFEALAAYRKALATEKPNLASRAASGKTLEVMVPAMPSLAGGSADLTGSNLTKVKEQPLVTATDYSGSYIHFGVREHGMAACANGMALHGGVRPYVGTFLVFADYCRPAIRLGALMEQPVVYVFTHDSIGLGEDGPTHQPVEHLASLRAMPNVKVFRPADAMETAECWELALKNDTGPSILALSRQTLPFQRTDDGSENLSARGAYVLKSADSPKGVIIATGSEVAIAVKAAEALASKGVPVNVVSAPSLELFAAQNKAYRDSVLPQDLPRVAVEAAARYGWDAFIGVDGGFVGMTGFGASAPINDLYTHFGITADAVAEEMLARV